MSDGPSEGAAFDEEGTRRVDAWLDRVEQALNRLGVPARTRRRLMADLQRDMESAGATGANLDELLPDDVVLFARDLADANGIRLEPQPIGLAATLRNMILAAVGGGVLGTVFSRFLLHSVLTQAMSQVPDIPEIQRFYGIGAALVVLCILAAVWLRLHERPMANKHTLVTFALAFTLGGLVGIFPSSLWAPSAGFSRAEIVLFIEAGVALLLCAAGLMLILRMTRTNRSSRVGLAA